MAVYVDTMQASFGRMKMCHMWADTREELFDMARKIGVQLKWFQRPDGACEFGMRASWEHFDIAMSKRKLAVQNGAIETDMITMAEHANKQQFIYQMLNGQPEKAVYHLRMLYMSASVRLRRVEQ